MEQFQSKLEPNSLHVGLLEGGCDVHVHVQEALHGPTLLRLLYLQLGEKRHKPGQHEGVQGGLPLEAPLLSVNPEEVHLPEVHHLAGQVVGPPVGALRAGVPRCPIPMEVSQPLLHQPAPVHDGLEEGGEGSDPNACPNEDSMLGLEDPGGRCAEGPPDVDVEGLVDLPDVSLLLHLLLMVTARPVQVVVQVTRAFLLSDPVEDEVVA